MKRICRTALFLWFGSAVFAGNIWAADWAPAGRGPIAITANFGGGSLTGETEISLAASTSNKDAKIGLAKLGLGLAYTQPVNQVLGIGGFAEARFL